MTNKKVLVIGLDGATWDLMRPWAEKGILPTIKRLMEKGVQGNLESTIPPFTIPAWISFATGKNPGQLGCYEFLIPRNSLNDRRPITTKDIHGKTFYEILNENGKRCIIINLPGSHPPRIKEIVITSILTQGNNCIFPPDLVNEIPELKNYRIVSDVPYFTNKDLTKFVDDVIKLEKIRFKCAKKLFEKEWDFFFLLFISVDSIQHVMYDKLLSETIDINSNPIKFYREIDRYVRWFIDNASDNTNILIMSDHGFEVYKKAFFINEWLRREGYLKMELKPKNLLAETETAQSKSRKKRESKKINIKLPSSLLKYLKSLVWLFPFYVKLMKILPIGIQATFQSKLSETVAYSISHADSAFGGIHINDKKRFIDGKVEMDNYENVRTEIINKLKQLKNPKTGENAIKNVWRKEDVYFGSQLDAASDIIFMLSDKYLVKSNVSNKIFDDKIMKPELRYNNHALQGIFLAYGPDIKKGGEIQGAKIYDLAPTILHILGIPLQEDMDGRVLKEIFKEDSELAKREIKYQEIDEREMIKEKIKKLRYIEKI